MRFNPNIMQRPRKRDNPEGRIVKQIITYYRAKGCVIGKIKNKGSFYHGRFIKDQYQFLGLPDILLFSPRMYFIEVKAKNGTQSEFQIAFESCCRTAGISYILAHSLEDVINRVK